MRLPLNLPPAHGRPVDVVTLGENSVDLVGVGPIAWGSSGKIGLSDFQVRAGGQAATVAVACARLGWRASYLGCVGDDHWADLVGQALSSAGVDAYLERRTGACSRIALVLVDERTGDRQILQHRDPRLDLTADAGLAARATAGRLLMVDVTDPEAAHTAAAAARAAAVPTLVDVDTPGPAAERVLPLVDVIVVSEAFAGACARAVDGGVGDGLQVIAAAYRPAMVVATLGPAGSLALCGGREVRSRAIAVEVKDTTGAGDAFRAGLVAGWLALGDQPELYTLLQYANAAGGLACRAVGAQAALPTAAELAAHVTGPGSGQSNETR